MKFFGVFLVICVIRACSSEDTDGGVVNGGGKTVKSPSHVVLRLANRKFLLCEGVLIEKNVVLTTAGCVDKYKSNPSNLEVVAGVTSTENIEKEKTIQKRRGSVIEIHPDYYKSKKTQGDIAFIKLSRPVKLTENVGIASYGDESAIKRNARLVGYGEGDQKAEKQLKVFSMEDCKAYFHSESRDGWFCTKSKEYEAEDGFHYVESSYAGAPLYYSDTGDKVVVCGLSPSKSGFSYINIPFYAPWIEKGAGVSRTKTAPSSSPSTETANSPTTTTPASTTSN